MLLAGKAICYPECSELAGHLLLLLLLLPKNDDIFLDGLLLLLLLLNPDSSVEGKVFSSLRPDFYRLQLRDTSRGRVRSNGTESQRSVCPILAGRLTDPCTIMEGDAR